MMMLNKGMPLEAGSSKSVISHNISEMVAAGHPHDVAVAAALHNADKFAYAGGNNTSTPELTHACTCDDKDKCKCAYGKEEDFVTYARVPIFDEHKGSEDGLDFDFDVPMLQKIVDRANHRMKDTGDVVLVTDNHSSDEQEAPILGYADNFEVAPFGEVSKRHAIYADLHIRKDKEERAKELPRRSIELWLDDMTADNIALLGSTRPARDLGLFEKKLSEKNRYQRVFSQRESMTPEEITKHVMEAMSAMPEIEYVRECMKHQEAKHSEEEVKSEEEAMKDDEHHEEVAEENLEHAEDLEPAKLRMQRDQERRRYAKLETEYKALFDKVSLMERKSRVAERKSDLLGVEQEGVMFDFAEELDLISDMEEDKYQKHLGHMRKRYQRSPVGAQFIKPAAIPVEGGKPTAEYMSPNDVCRAVEEKLKKGAK